MDNAKFQTVHTRGGDEKDPGPLALDPSTKSAGSIEEQKAPQQLAVSRRIASCDLDDVDPECVILDMEELHICKEGQDSLMRSLRDMSSWNLKMVLKKAEYYARKPAEIPLEIRNTQVLGRLFSWSMNQPELQHDASSQRLEDNGSMSERYREDYLGLIWSIDPGPRLCNNNLHDLKLLISGGDYGLRREAEELASDYEKTRIKFRSGWYKCSLLYTCPITCPRGNICDAARSGILFLRIHFRVFRDLKGRIQKTPGLFREPPPPDNRYLARDLDVREFRRTFALLVPFTTPPGGLVSELTEDFMILRLVENELEHEFNAMTAGDKIHLCERATGIAAFQRMMWVEIERWTVDWRSALGAFEHKITFKIEDVLDPKKRRKLMYDDHKLTRSELYFTMDQLLLIFEDWTKELVTDLQAFRQEIADTFLNSRGTGIAVPELELGAEPRGILEKNWDNLLSHAEQSQQEVQKLINRKREEIRSLWDGLYNTIQVRESTRSTRMNQIMLIFTIATILYLPPTFVATFMALDLFQTSDTHTFWAIFGGTTAVTYLAAVIGFLWVYWDGVMLKFDNLRANANRDHFIRVDQDGANTVRSSD